MAFEYGERLRRKIFLESFEVYFAASEGRSIGPAGMCESRLMIHQIQSFNSPGSPSWKSRNIFAGILDTSEVGAQLFQAAKQLNSLTVFTYQW